MNREFVGSRRNEEPSLLTVIDCDRQVNFLVGAWDTHVFWQDSRFVVPFIHAQNIHLWWTFRVGQYLSKSTSRCLLIMKVPGQSATRALANEGKWG